MCSCYILRSGYSACGGGGGSDDTKTCDTFIAGQWEQSHTLTSRRKDHVSWRSPMGTLLIGGWWSQLTTELLSTTNSGTTELFILLNATRY